MSTLTPDEAKQRYMQAMGADLGRVYHALWNELAWLHTKWDEYIELFGTKPSRIELINRAAGHFFRLVQDMGWEDTLLHLARLTDSPKSSGRENLTIRRLPALVPDQETRLAVTELVALAIAKTKFCRDWRNRHIAHRDLGLALAEGAAPLEPASRALVNDALGSISDVMNALSVRYLDSTTLFEGIASLSGAVSLLYVIDDGLRMQQERRERLQAGEYRPEDHEARDL
jgi:HEPN superfamily AbiU2-like protein